MRRSPRRPRTRCCHWMRSRSSSTACVSRRRRSQREALVCEADRWRGLGEPGGSPSWNRDSACPRKRTGEGPGGEGPLMSENRVNILLVDDNEENLLALHGILEPLDENLVHATYGVDAL